MAPLKGFASNREIEGVNNFHNEKVMAPLKALTQDGIKLGLVQFP